ncbi:hypothetical protein [Thiolapillus sp.]
MVLDMPESQKTFLDRIRTFPPRELARVEQEALAITQQKIGQREWDLLDSLFIGLLRQYEQENPTPGAMQTADFEDDVAAFMTGFRDGLRKPLARAVELARKNRNIHAIWYNFEHGGEDSGKSQLVLTDHYTERQDCLAPVPEHWLGNRIEDHPRFRLPKITIGVSTYVNYEYSSAVEAAILMRAHLDSRIAATICRIIEETGTPGVPVVISRSIRNPVIYRS